MRVLNHDPLDGAMQNNYVDLLFRLISVVFIFFKMFLGLSFTAIVYTVWVGPMN